MKVKSKNNKFFFTLPFDDAKFTENTMPPGTYDLESFSHKIKRNFNEEIYFTEETYPLVIKPNFSTLGSIIEFTPGRWIQISFVHENSIRDFLGFHSVAIYEKV